LASRSKIRLNYYEGEDMSKASILKEFWDFLKVRKRFWLAPIIIILLLLSVLIMFAQSSAVAPFIYTLF
jgi:hypothetical protein